MVLRRLIKQSLLVVLLAFSSALMAKSEFVCKEVKVQSKSIKASEEATLCFLRDDTYFISGNCSDLKCKFIERLKVKKMKYSEEERPGVTLCRAIQGVPEDIALPDSKLTITRCLFTKEKTSISLNLLESWDGKHFSGPSRPLAL